MRLTTDLELAGRQVVVCGGDPAALTVISGLLEERAEVTVLATQVPTTVRDWAARGLLTWHPRPCTEPDLSGAALVVAATGSAESDEELRASAARLNRPALRAAGADPARSAEPGRVVLVGGGPGPEGLLTLAGLQAIRSADVLVCDRLAPLSALREAKPGAEVVDVAKIPRGAFTPQERINELLITHARRGSTVVRLKGGDPFVFGRGGEEVQACAAAGVPVEVIPGVTSAVAAPALAGIPLTHRSLTQGFTVVSGHLPPGAPGSTLDWSALARANTTLVIMMGVATLSQITAELARHGLPPSTPAATVADAGLPSQRTVRGRLHDIAELTRDAEIRPPAITVIGAVAGL